MTTAVAKETSKFVEPVNGKLTVPVFGRAGDAKGTVELDAAEFGGKINRQLMHEVVLMFLANQRAGRTGESSGRFTDGKWQADTKRQPLGIRGNEPRRRSGVARSLVEGESAGSH